MGSLHTASADFPDAIIAEAIAESRNKIENREFDAALQVIDGVYNRCSNIDNQVPLEGLRADCFLELGDPSAALKCYKRILEIQPEAPYWAHVGYANVLERLGHYDKAVEQMLVALEKEYSYELIERVVKLAQFTANPPRIHKAIVDMSLKHDSEEMVFSIGELLITEGVSAEGGRLFQFLIKNSADEVQLVARIVKMYLAAGESKLALQKIEAWRTKNSGDTRLDSLYDFCQESKILDSHNGIPCLLVDKEKQLSEFELRVNGDRVQNGVQRYSRLLTENTSDLVDAHFTRYLLLLPECYLDTKSDTYTVEVTELSGGQQREFRGNYPLSKVIYDERDLYQGDFEYLGGNRIHGWYRSKADKVDRLGLYINGEFIEEIRANLERPDVAADLGIENLQSGFDYSWDNNIEVNKLELRNVVTGLPVLCTPIKVQRLEDAVQELENCLPRNVADSEMSSSAVKKIFKSLRKMPQLSLEYTYYSADLLRNYEDGVSVIVPVYNALADVKRCIASLLEGENTSPFEILVVNDCSPASEVNEFLDDLGRENHEVNIINSRVNRGFVKTVNKGLMARIYKNVVILNSDTVVPEKFVDRMSAAAQLDKDYGVITPLSNNATIFSFPLALENNNHISLKEMEHIDKTLYKHASDEIYEMPTGHGFCMYVSGEVLESVGTLNEEKWGVGYGEENDFCQRVKMHGWKIGAYYGMYVGHVGSVSFGDEKREMQIAKNLRKLNKIYPEYDGLIQKFINFEGDSRIARNRLQILRWVEDSSLDSVLFVTHSLGGGTSEYLNRCTKSLSQQDVRSVILTTNRNKDIVLCDSDETLRCEYKREEIPVLLSHLNQLRVGDVILNSTFNFPGELFDHIKEVAGKYTVVLHDYSWICPRINMIDASGAYCGMPSNEVCVKCVEVSGTHESFTENWNNISTGLDQWLTKNKVLLENARKIIAPSKDAADRISRKYHELKPTVKYHSDQFQTPVQFTRYRATGIEEHTIGIFGMIGDHKGMKLLKQLSWLFSVQHPGIKIVFFGAMSEYDWLDGYSNVKCVGEYSNESIGGLIKQEKPTLSLFLSMWPETYCYALTDAISHGVFPIAFDIGAFKERIEMHNYGATVPFETNVEKLYHSIVDVICSENFQLASITDIEDGVGYTKFSSDYLKLEG